MSLISRGASLPPLSLSLPHRHRGLSPRTTEFTPSSHISLYKPLPRAQSRTTRARICVASGERASRGGVWMSWSIYKLFFFLQSGLVSGGMNADSECKQINYEKDGKWSKYDEKKTKIKSVYWNVSCLSRTSCLCRDATRERTAVAECLNALLNVKESWIWNVRYRAFKKMGAQEHEDEMKGYVLNPVKSVDNQCQFRRIYKIHLWFSLCI